MEYTVAKLARLAGITARTLRYYDTIGLLCPTRISSSGYRIYGAGEVDRLQQILFYRELGFPLEEIAALLSDPGFDPTRALRGHREGIIARRDRLNVLIATLDQTIAAAERSIPMSDKEKFTGFKEQMIAQNEAQYGAEVRAKYGDDAVDASNEKLRAMAKGDYERAEALAAEILTLLDQLTPKEDPAGEEGKRLASLHREWLCLYWPAYTPEAHRGLVDMYVEDDRFAAYYDRGEPGKAQFLRDAVKAWLASEQN